MNVLPGLRSTYRWQGAVEQADEALLLIKTIAARFDALRDAVLAQHPYELPEVLAVQVAHVHPPYLQWLIEHSR